ncbi:hypothetical protein [Salinicoccus halitifaciens]|uniref:Ribonuclease HIII n=1 Tax=Salinicoccus halitifaciens TaxID=1073415 RepID=A0ABV2E5U0_9STAP|nr:hypothetical protein [Salinicoccus halitifaciens]MCD2137164.1 hypothetical protein [Salinicoccus halitifaciens]
MELSIEKLYALVEGLNSLVEKELPISAAFSIQKNISIVTAELETSDKLRDKIIQKFASEIREDGSADIPHENLEEFRKEYDELMQHKVEIELTSIKHSQLGETITPLALGQLMPILVEDVEEDKHV